MKRIGRNDPCPCGSGRKYKKCCLRKRPREQYVYIGFREAFDGLTLDDGQVFVNLPLGKRAKADPVLAQTQYTRTNGREKVLSSVPDAATFDIQGYLASHFDAIWAVDTNTKRLNKDDVSVSSILECYPRMTAPTEVEIACRKNGTIVFRNCPNGEAEKHAWYGLVTRITENPGYREDMRIALVTDHDLQKHCQYNAREIPIYQGFFLPANFTLVYATSDANENILNSLIRQCDRDAGKKLHELETEGRIAFADGFSITIGEIPDMAKSA